MKTFLLPFSVSTLCLMMAACGGGSNNINEDPTLKPVETTAVGCSVEDSNECFEFTLEYPVAGLQYTCAKDKINSFSTKLNGNVVTGGCDADDTATFFLNATNNYRIEFGSVKMSDLGVLSAESVPVHLTLLDMAKGITGQAAQSLSQSDETVQVAMQFVKIFQAIGNQKSSNGNVIGDIQLLELDEITLDGLEQITDSVTAQDLETGRYAEVIAPWIDVGVVSDDQAFEVLTDASYLSLSSLYQAEITPFAAAYEGMIGYAGTGNNRRTLLGEFFLLMDRSGFTQGYGMQWRGVPSQTGNSVANAVLLSTEANPLMMRAAAQSDFISPVSKRMGTVSPYRMITANDETLSFNGGRLINDYAVAGSSIFYQYLTGTDKDDVPTSDLAKWTQSTNEGQYSGGADFIKAFPISYLDNRVFKSPKTVENGEDYYFPLYATLTFEFADTTVDDVKLGIVIDENGDIRSDIGPNATENDMSGMCGVSDSSLAEAEDDYGVMQYRLGTMTATNYQEAQGDRSFGIRMIIAGEQFAGLDGVILGLSTNATVNEQTVSLGARVNIHSLLDVKSGDSGALPNIVLTSPSGGVANWVNFFNIQKAAYIAGDEEYDATPEEEDRQKRLRGTMSIDLADCYSVKTK